MSYQWSAMVGKLAKPGDAVLANIDADKADLLHGVLGLVGEAGELADAIKKHVVYGKPLDIDNVIEELGDLEFYLEMIRRSRLILVTREACLTHNYMKLLGAANARYKSGTYSDEQAIVRLDKQGEYNGEKG